MKLSEMTQLLHDIASVDPKFGAVTDDRVLAWKKSISPHLGLNMAIDYVAKHYSLSEKTLMPVDMNQYFHQDKRNQPYQSGKDEPIVKNAEWRKRCTWDLMAKILLDRELPYVNGGHPWKYEIGTGDYYREAKEKGYKIDPKQMPAMFKNIDAR